MSYTKNFTPTYENGWYSSPATTTPITATALNNYDEAIEYIEDYLEGAELLDREAADEIYVQNKSLSLTKVLDVNVPTSYVFNNNMITEDSAIDVYASLNKNYSSMLIENGKCTVTYPKSDSPDVMTCKIYIK